MNYYRILNEGLDRYVERELREDNEEALDEGVFDNIRNKVKDKVTNDRFYYVNGVELGKDKKAEKRFWDIANSTNLTEKEKERLKSQGNRVGKPFEAKGKDKEGKEITYTFEITIQPKKVTKQNKEAGEKEEKRKEEIRKTTDTKGNLNNKYKLTSNINDKGEITLKLGDTELATYPNKEVALKAIGDAVNAITNSK